MVEKYCYMTCGKSSAISENMEEHKGLSSACFAVVSDCSTCISQNVFWLVKSVQSQLAYPSEFYSQALLKGQHS